MPPSFSRLALAAGMLASAPAVHANPSVVLYVDKTAPSGGDGTNWNKAYRDIQEAFDNLSDKVSGYASPPDCEIRVAQGEYKPDRGTGDRNMRYFKYVTGASAASLSLVGSFGGLHGSNPDVSDIHATVTRISGDLNGDDEDNFANRADNSETLLWISARNARVNVMNTRFEGARNTTNYYVEQGSALPPIAAVSLSVQLDNPSILQSSIHVLVADCLFRENESVRGPGALAMSASRPVVFSSVFEHNRSIVGKGGALQQDSWSGGGRILDSRFTSNAATNGGATWIRPYYCNIETCVFDSNSADMNGGALDSDGSCKIYSSLFLRNTAGSAGGAVNFSNGNPSTWWIESSTFVRNAAPSAPAIRLAGPNMGFWCNIVWENKAEAGKPIIDLSASNYGSGGEISIIQGGVSSVAFTPGNFTSTVLNEDPLFVAPITDASPNIPFAEVNYRLRLDSPALRAAEGRSSIDLDGNVAPDWHNQMDLGCYFNNTMTCLANLASQGINEVNDDDFAIFATAYDLMLISEGANPSADFNRDGVINDADFQLFVGAYDNGVCP